MPKSNEIFKEAKRMNETELQQMLGHVKGHWSQLRKPTGSQLSKLENNFSNKINNVVL